MNTLTTYLVDINSISYELEFSYPADAIAKLARILLAQGGTTMPLIVRKTGWDQYELIEGEIVLLAAIEANKIDDYFEMIRVYIQDEDESIFLADERDLIDKIARVSIGLPSAIASTEVPSTEVPIAYSVKKIYKITHNDFWYDDVAQLHRIGDRQTERYYRLLYELAIATDNRDDDETEYLCCELFGDDYDADAIESISEDDYIMSYKMQYALNLLNDDDEIVRKPSAVEISIVDIGEDDLYNEVCLYLTSIGKPCPAKPIADDDSLLGTIVSEKLANDDIQGAIAAAITHADISSQIAKDAIAQIKANQAKYNKLAAEMLAKYKPL